MDAHNYTFDAVPFSYFAATEVELLAPTGESAARRHVRDGVGPGFVGGSDYRCRFGSASVRASVVDGGNLTCTTPAQASGESVAVEISMNGQQYSTSKVPFVYHDPSAVTSLSPSSGVSAGSTVVRVLGSGFQPFEETLCRFGSGSVAARWASGGEVVCVSLPSHETGASVSVDLGLATRRRSPVWRRCTRCRRATARCRTARSR